MKRWPGWDHLDGRFDTCPHMVTLPRTTTMTETNTLSWHSLHCTLLDYSQQQSITQNTTTQAGWFLRPDCAPSSERPGASIAARRRAAGSIRISRRASCCCSSATAGIATGANFKIYLLRQFCSNRVLFFTTHRRHRRKKMMDQNFEIRILWFLRIFWNFQKGIARSLCGRSRPLWSRPN